MALHPGMIEFGKLDLGKSDDYPLCATGIGSAAKKTSKWYPSIWIPEQEKLIDLPDSGEAKIKYRVTRRETITRDGKTRHSANLDVESIETEDTKPKAAKGGEEGKAKPLKFAGTVPGMIEFSGRSRDSNGQFIPEGTGGVDPNSMAAAYGGVGQERAARLAAVEKVRKVLRPGMLPPPSVTPQQVV